VSKKLLEVKPEALERRRLRERRNAITGSKKDKKAMAKAAAEAKTDPAEFGGNPCRRLDGTPLSEEERRRLGVTGCVGFEGGTSSSLSVSLSRAASKGSEHSHSIAISMKDDNIQDSFAVKVSMDPHYGTPIFTTLGGRSTCPGETGTTRRDSRVTIEDIKPLCVSQEDVDRRALYNQSLCPSALTCECKDLEPGQDAIFSVVLQNLSPWETSVSYLLRAVNGASTPWDSGKYTRDFYLDDRAGCEAGDLGSLVIKTVDGENLRNGDGITFAPLPYGQHEVRIIVSRPDFAPQCFSYSELELELVAVCEDTDWGDAQDFYQYEVTMDKTNGDVTIIHPEWDATALSFKEGTTARGPDTSRETFSVSWQDSGDPLSGGGSAAGNDALNKGSSSGLAVAAILLLFLIAAAFYAYRRRKIAQVEVNQKETTGGDAVPADANYDAINVETDETNKEDQDVEKAPLRPTAYPGGQSLPPWPYPEAKPTARPTPASYDPACILKVSWPRDAARPTEFALRETFEALAPVTNVGLGSGNAAMVVFKDAAGARAAEAAYDGPWRVAAAKPPAAAADQPPPPPKTGDV
jgi:hypothetical protein